MSDRYQKRPIIVQAWQWDGKEPGIGGRPCPVWIGEAIIIYARDSSALGDSRRLLIDTLEGVMTARKGDWIIKGIEGEIYPCKPEIFAKTYMPM